MNTCVFCRIVEGSMPAKLVRQDELSLAFEDINPQAPTHILVIPKRHIRSVQEAGENDAGLLGHLMLACKEIAKERGLAEAGYRVVTNVGSYGGQTVFHLHFHLLGGRHMTWPPG